MLNIIIGFAAVVAVGLGVIHATKWGEGKNIIDLGGQGRGENKGAK